MIKKTNNSSESLVFFLIVLFVLLLFLIVTSSAQCLVDNPKSSSVKKIIITKEDLRWFGETIFQRECGGKIDRIVAWNHGEEFASFGIGHFIWYPKAYEGPFDESFPVFLAFAKKRGVKLPVWLDNSDGKDCPWKTREEFYENINSYKMNSLKAFLIETMHHQSLFVVQRFTKALPKMMHAVSSDKKKHIKKQFFRIADTTIKLYALIDYVNFKGEGIKHSERYHDQGWGLLQVLEEMKGTQKGDSALCEFARAAEMVLIRRVINSPVERNERQWLNGWKNRVNYYRTLTRYL